MKLQYNPKIKQTTPSPTCSLSHLTHKVRQGTTTKTTYQDRRRTKTRHKTTTRSQEAPENNKTAQQKRRKKDTNHTDVRRELCELVVNYPRLRHQTSLLRARLNLASLTGPPQPYPAFYKRKVRIKPSPLQDPHTGRALRARLEKKSTSYHVQHSQLILVATYLFI